MNEQWSGLDQFVLFKGEELVRDSKVRDKFLRFERSQFMNIARPIVAIARSNFQHAKDNQDSLMLIWYKSYANVSF